jgi:hypothetical protein
VLGALILTAYCLPGAASGQERTVIDNNFPGAYQVEVADVNGDRKPDIVAVGGNTCAWYENPTWRKRVVTTGKQTPGIISSATADVDGDGKSEIAIAYEFAMNRPTTGKLLLAVQGSRPDDPWKLVPVAEIGSIHRLRWGDVDRDGRPDLVVAPIFGPRAGPPSYADPARLGVFRRFAWHQGFPKFEPVALRPILHAIDVVDLFGEGHTWIATADDTGTSLVHPELPAAASNGREPRWIEYRLTPADDAAEPGKRGASEVHIGRMKDGRRLLATIEPWHGNRVCVAMLSLRPRHEPGPIDSRVERRIVLDDTLDAGHALWVADIDGDGDDEVFAGHRGKDHRVSMYHFDRGKNAWSRTVLDRETAAQDLRGGDIDGDGTPDVVAVGGSTHNVVWYCFRRP